MAGALCVGTWRREAHDEPAPPDECGGVTAGHRPGRRGRRSPAARFGKSGSQSAASCESPLCVPPSLGTGFTGRAEPTAAELAPTAQQRDVGGSGRSWARRTVERAHDGMNRADDAGSGESVSLSAESGQLQPHLDQWRSHDAHHRQARARYERPVVSGPGSSGGLSPGASTISVADIVGAVRDPGQVARLAGLEPRRTQSGGTSDDAARWRGSQLRRHPSATAPACRRRPRGRTSSSASCPAHPVETRPRPHARRLSE